MPERTVTGRSPSPISALAGWLRQGTESFFASQRILLDLVMRQNAHTIGALQERLVEARNAARTAATELAGEGISNFIAAERVLLNLAERQNEIVTTLVQERVPGPPPVAAMTQLFSRGIDTVIDMHQHFLSMAARQADEWIDSTKSGEPFEGIQVSTLARDTMEHFVRSQKKFLDVLAEETAHATGKNTHTKAGAAKRTELTELARQSAEAYIDAQKKLLDVAMQQLKVNAKTAGETVQALLPVKTIDQLAHHSVDGLVESQKAILDLVVKQPGQAKAHEAARPKAARKRPAPKRAKPVAEPVGA